MDRNVLIVGERAICDKRHALRTQNKCRMNGLLRVKRGRQKQ